MFFAAAFNLNSNPMDLSGIYTVKIVIRFSLGQSIFMGMEISLRPTTSFLVSLFSDKTGVHIYPDKSQFVQWKFVIKASVTSLVQEEKDEIYL